jgi:hypothetical protein
MLRSILHLLTINILTINIYYINNLYPGRGETFEQYDVFQKYLVQVEEKFDSFSEMEGYANARECLREINILVKKDGADRAKMMKDLQAKLRKAQSQWESRCQFVPGDAAASTAAATAGGEDADAKADSKTADGESKGERAGSGRKAMVSPEGKSTGDAKDSSSSSSSPSAVAAGGGEDLDEDMDLPVMMFFQPMSMDAMLDQVRGGEGRGGRILLVLLF